MSLLEGLEYIGVAIFALSGARVAIEKGLDLFGIYIMGFVTAMGGGVLRDVVLNRGIPVLFSSYEIIGVIVTFTTIGIILKGNIQFGKVILFLDAVGLAAFTISAAAAGIDSEYNLPAILFMSVITGVGGGVIRDLLCQRVPVILREEIYGTAALVGAFCFWGLSPYLDSEMNIYLCMGIIILIRWTTYRKKINLPAISTKGSEKTETENITADFMKDVAKNRIENSIEESTVNQEIVKQIYGEEQVDLEEEDID